LGMLESGIQVAQSKEDEDTKRFAKEIADEVPLLNRALQATREALEKPKLADLDANIDSTVEAVEKLSEQFKATEEKCKKMANYQEVLGLVADEYDALEEVAALMNMQQSLWTASRDFTKLTAQWKDLPVGSVSSDDLEKVRLRMNFTFFNVWSLYICIYGFLSSLYFSSLYFAHDVGGIPVQQDGLPVQQSLADQSGGEAFAGRSRRV